MSHLRRAERKLGRRCLLAFDLGGPKLRTAAIEPGPEVRRFRPELPCSIYHGPERRLDREADVAITSYAVMRLDVDRLAPVAWKTLILDESQSLKNPDSQVARAAARLQARFCLALTGTPVENRLDELWSQFHLLNRGLLGTRRDFDEHYARPIQRGDAEAVERLRAAGTPCDLELLYGLPVRASIKQARELGLDVRIYVPYGEAYMPYALSQVRRKPRILGWLVKDLVASAWARRDNRSE